MGKKKISLLTPIILLSLFVIALIFTFVPPPATQAELAKALRAGKSFSISPTPSNTATSPFNSVFSKLLPLKTSNLTTFIAVGDIMLGRYVNVKMLEYNDFKYPFLKTADFTSNADITFGNLEAPIIADCPTTETGMLFCARPESIEGLKYGGFDILSIANNHILNHEQAGLDQTKLLLQKNGILTSDSNNLTIKQFNNSRLGFLSFDLVTYPEKLTFIHDRVKNSTKEVDILIVSLHWGNEYQKNPTEAQKILARQIIDAGAKVVIGHHPHVTQPTESYHNGLIFYSLGNFIFDQPWSEETKKGNIAKIIFEGKEIKSYEIIPVYIEDSSQPVVRN